MQDQYPPPIQSNSDFPQVSTPMVSESTSKGGNKMLIGLILGGSLMVALATIVFAFIYITYNNKETIRNNQNTPINKEEQNQNSPSVSSKYSNSDNSSAKCDNEFILEYEQKIKNAQNIEEISILTNEFNDVCKDEIAKETDSNILSTDEIKEKNRTQALASLSLPSIDKELQVDNTTYKVNWVRNYGSKLDYEGPDVLKNVNCNSTNGQFIGINVSITNNSDSKINSIFVTPQLVDGEKNEYYPGINGPGLCDWEDKTDFVGEVSPNETVSISFLFDSPETLTEPILLEVVDGSYFNFDLMNLPADYPSEPKYSYFDLTDQMK